MTPYRHLTREQSYTLSRLYQAKVSIALAILICVSEVWGSKDIKRHIKENWLEEDQKTIENLPGTDNIALVRLNHRDKLYFDYLKILISDNVVDIVYDSNRILK